MEKSSCYKWTIKFLQLTMITLYNDYHIPPLLLSYNTESVCLLISTLDCSASLALIEKHTAGKIITPTEDGIPDCAVGTIGLN